MPGLNEINSCYGYARQRLRALQANRSTGFLRADRFQQSNSLALSALVFQCKPAVMFTLKRRFPFQWGDTHRFTGGNLHKTPELRLSTLWFHSQLCDEDSFSGNSFLCFTLNGIFHWNQPIESIERRADMEVTADSFDANS